VEVRQAGQVLAIWAKAKGSEVGPAQAPRIGWVQVAVQHARIEHLPIFFRADGEVAKAVGRAFIGAVKDLPIHQPPVPGQADRACANPAQWKRNFIGFPAAIYKCFRIHTSSEFF